MFVMYILWLLGIGRGIGRRNSGLVYMGVNDFDEWISSNGNWSWVGRNWGSLVNCKLWCMCKIIWDEIGCKNIGLLYW